MIREYWSGEAWDELRVIKSIDKEWYIVNFYGGLRCLAHKHIPTQMVVQIHYGGVNGWSCYDCHKEIPEEIFDYYNLLSFSDPTYIKLDSFFPIVMNVNRRHFDDDEA